MFFIKLLDLFFVEYSNLIIANLKFNLINGNKIKLKAEIKMDETPPMSPKNYKKL